jgi:hypothetical protein
VLVRRLGQGYYRRFPFDGLAVVDDRVGDFKRYAGVIFSEILVIPGQYIVSSSVIKRIDLQADFEMELSYSGYNVFTRLCYPSLDTRIRLG